MKYLAFLRGINISGKNKVPMAELKAGFEDLGYSEVSTYLNSGNVRFTADSTDIAAVRKNIESMIREKFAIDVPVHVIGYDELQNILSNAPSWWGTEDKDSYDNLIFILSGDTPEDIAEMIGEVSEGLERIQIFENIIFWTFDRKLYQKCSWWKKTAAPGIGEKLTIRTAGTLRKM